MGPDNISKILLLFVLNNLRSIKKGPIKWMKLRKNSIFHWIYFILQLKDRSHETKKKILNFNIWWDLFRNLIIPKILFRIGPIKCEKTH